MHKVCFSIVLAFSLVGCGQQAETSAAAEAVTAAEDHSEAVVEYTGTRATSATRRPAQALAPTTPDFSYWPAATLDAGTAKVSCDYDYKDQGDGEPIGALEFFNLVDALDPCREHGVLRLRYRGKIDAGFTALMERVTEVADRMEIRSRVLDIDSSGGHVEDAIRAGDGIGGAGWSIWVREGSVCHSACVLILAAGDTRSIAGKIGIHRLMRLKSKATNRAELSDELRDITAQLREYLERNGVAAPLADRMMTIPNRSLHLLTSDELQQYGLDGTNAAQDDLDRIRVARKCGDDFAQRRDAFGRAFARECMQPGKAFESMAECGKAMGPRFGFPDAGCPDEGPVAQLERQPLALPPELLRRR